jgi:hypothetical protein
MRLWPTSKQARKREACSDWTPSQACSRARRHYIVGDMCEISELCAYLAAVSPHLAELLLPLRRRPSTKSQTAAVSDTPSALVSAAVANSLSGPVAALRPRATQRVPSLAQLAARTAAGEANARSGAGPEAGCGGSAAAAASSAAGSSGHTLDTVDKVHAFLKRCGAKHPERANPCLKAGLLRGKLQVPPACLKEGADPTPYLQHVLLSTPCDECGKNLQCTVKQALGQCSSGGDYEDGNPGGAIQCKQCRVGAYITGLCEGRPSSTSGKFHNHCTECPDFGTCIGDYRNDHCSRCGGHYFSGLSGFACPCRGSDRPGTFGGSDYGSDDNDDDDDEHVRERDAEIIPDTPSADCWSGQLRGIESYEVAAHSALLTRVLEAKLFLLEMPSAARQQALAMLGGLEMRESLEFLLRPGSEISAMSPAELRAAAPGALHFISVLQGLGGFAGALGGAAGGVDHADESGEEEGGESEEDGEHEEDEEQDPPPLH